MRLFGFLLMSLLIQISSSIEIEGCIATDPNDSAVCTACDQWNYSTPNLDGSLCHSRLSYCSSYSNDLFVQC